MKRRPRPVCHPLDQTVFQRIDVHIIKAPFYIPLILASVLEKPTLPHPLFFTLLATAVDVSTMSVFTQPTPGKFGFDASPACRVIPIIPRQLPYRMKVVRKQNNCRNLKSTVPTHGIYGFSEQSTPQSSGQNRPTLVSHDCEEENTSISR